MNVMAFYETNANAIEFERGSLVVKMKNELQNQGQNAALLRGLRLAFAEIGR